MTTLENQIEEEGKKLISSIRELTIRIADLADVVADEIEAFENKIHGKNHGEHA